MSSKFSMAVFVTALVGCGASATHVPTAMRSMPAAAAMPAASESAETVAVLDPTFAPSTAAATVDRSTLPAAPWAEAHLGARDVPGPLLTAWERADNREWCAPIAPRTFGAAEGARARTTELEGGWAVEFDRRGLPGVDRTGASCSDCGRGVFGIAGTGMTPEELVDSASDALLPTPSFSDGSHAEVEISEAEHVAAATITISDQGCVYQVWSFLGRAHLDELVRELRIVELPRSRGTATLARATTAD